MGEWQVAGKKGRKPRGCPCNGVHAHDVVTTAQPTENMSPEALAAASEHATKRVRERATALASSTFFADSLAAVRAVWRPIHQSGGDNVQAGHRGRLLALGIGSVELSTSSSQQLALAWLLAEELGVSDRSWADPQMRRADVAAGEALGFRGVDASAAVEGPTALARSSEEPLLLYMPHCDRALYERVLAVNMSVDSDDAPGHRLANVVIVGNSFEVYAMRDEMRMVPAGTPGAPTQENLLQRLRHLIVEKAMPEYEPCVEAFNDLAVISFKEPTPV